MDVIVSDAGVDAVEGAAAETPALEPEPEQQREIPTPVLPIKTTPTKKQVPREKKADQKKAGKKTEQEATNIVWRKRRDCLNGCTRFD